MAFARMLNNPNVKKGAIRRYTEKMGVTNDNMPEGGVIHIAGEDPTAVGASSKFGNLKSTPVLGTRSLSLSSPSKESAAHLRPGTSTTSSSGD